MKNRFTKHISLLIALFGMIFSGCTDDITPVTTGNGDEEYDGILIRIPDSQGLVSSVTRTESNTEQIDLVGKEGLITSLHVYTVKANGVVKHANLLKDNNITEVTLNGHSDDATKYRNFDITDLFRKDGDNSIDEGSYKVYVVANLESYLNSDDGEMPEIANEDGLKNLPLYFFKTNDGQEKAEYLLSRSHVETYGLPMACLPGEIQYSEEGSDEVSTGTINITSSGRGTIHADLGFLCSKVRYSIFFDKKNTASAAEIFGDMSFNISGVDALNVIGNGTTVGADKSATVTTPDRHNLEKLTFSEKAFTNPDNYPVEGEENTPLDELGEIDLDQRAWQGVFYLPENSSQTSTTLSFAANAVKTANGEAAGNGSGLGFKIPLLPKVTDGSKAVKRSTAYDIIAKVTKVDDVEILRMEPQIWKTIPLQYVLTPPAYLHVDNTRLSLSGGEKKEIKYESNADIQFDIPKYNGVNIYSLKKNKEEGTIEVSVNSAISTSDFTNIRAEEGKYNYFHIVAGNIRKKIEITPLDLHRFLTLSPSNITLDIREKMGSGRYSGDYDVEIETNVENFKISDVDWGAVAPGGNLKMYIRNADDEEEEVKFNTQDYSPIEGIRRIRIHFENINSGDPFWNSNKSLNFKVVVDNTGLNVNNTDYIADTNVRFNVVKSTDNYTIHFNDGGENWTNPHIYIYQCLEIPSYWNKEVTSGGKTYYTGSMPVGYQDQTDDSKYNTMAALEYIFTGAVAFLGWDAYSNAISLNSLVVDNNKGWYEEGFWIFSDGWYKDGDTGCSWNPNYSVAESRYAIGPDVDFCKEYRQTVDCAACKEGTGNKTWPGIKMEKESDGWWKFELTGMATAGKALIMFADGHSYYTGIRRWPSDMMVGIPLFDYPSKEGWYSMASCEFSSSKEDAEAASAKKTYLEYDNSGTNWGEVYAYFYGYDDNGYNAGVKVKEWPGHKMTEDPSSNKWHCQIPRDWANNPGNKHVNVIFNNNSTAQSGDTNLGDLRIVTR